MLQLARSTCRSAAQFLVSPAPRCQLRRLCNLNYKSRVDFSSLPTDSRGRRVAPDYFCDHTKSPDDILRDLSDSDRLRMEQIRKDIEIQAALGLKYVPDVDKLTSYKWLLLLSAPSYSMLNKRLLYLARMELSRQGNATRRQLNAEADSGGAKKPVDAGKLHLFRSVYGRICASELKSFYTANVLHNYQLAPTIVFDMSYHNDMGLKALRDLCGQLRAVLHSNRELHLPMRLHFSNLLRNTPQYYTLNRSLHRTQPEEQVQAFEESLPYEFSDACHTETFDKSRLVYLSPDARHTMSEFDENAIYIVGGIVDIASGGAGQSLKKARVAGIRCQRFPLTCSLRSGLPLNIVFDILATLRTTGSWDEAELCVPLRKIVSQPVSRRRREKKSESGAFSL